MPTKAIVIKKQNTNEYDQLVTCYTEDFGKLTAIAKSILKPNSVQALHLDVLNLVEFDLINGRGIPIITGAQAINSYPDIKDSLAKTAVAYFFTEVMDKMVFENDKDGQLWSFWVSFLDGLNKYDSNPNLRPMSLLREGQIKLLDILGYFPETDSCRSCEDKLGESNFGAFNHALGGVICKRCFLSGLGGILISNEDFGLMRRSDNFAGENYRRSILDGMFEYVSGGKFYSLELLAVVK